MSRSRSVAHAYLDHSRAPGLGLGSALEDSWLIAKVERGLAKAGIEARLDSRGAFVTADGASFGLDNLVRRLRSAPRAAWSDIVASHVADLCATHELGPVVPDVADPCTIILPRIVGGASLDGESMPIPSYATPLGADLYVIAAVRRPGQSLFLYADDALDAVGGWAGVHERAWEALRGFGMPDLEIAAAPEKHGTPIVFLDSEDTYGATRLLIVDELLGSPPLSLQASHGMLVAMPHCRSLVVALLGPTGFAETVGLLGDLVPKEYRSRPGPLSPLLYYRGPDGGPLERVTMRDHWGHPQLSIGPRLGSMLVELDHG